MNAYRRETVEARRISRITEYQRSRTEYQRDRTEYQPDATEYRPKRRRFRR